MSKTLRPFLVALAIATLGIVTLNRPASAAAAFLTTDQVLNQAIDTTNKALKVEAVTGGASSSVSPFFNDAISTTSIQAKAAGTAYLYAVHGINTTAAAAYLQVFAKASSSVTVGTTAPDWVIRIPGTGSVDLAFSTPIALGGNGLSFAGTTTATGGSPAVLSLSATYK